MVIVKYFFEEPAALEVLASPDASQARRPEQPSSLTSFLAGPRYFRGYLTATDLDAERTGATAVSRPEVWADSLVAALAVGSVAFGSSARASSAFGGTVAVDLRDALMGADPGAVLVLVPLGITHDPEAAGLAEVPDLSGDIREHTAIVRSFLDQGCVLLRAEPAHDGADWTVFSPVPLSERVAQAFRNGSGDAAFFVIPQRSARGEHKFYFERYDLDLFKQYRVR